jgi:hypothetical protein
LHLVGDLLELFLLQFAAIFSKTVTEFLKKYVKLNINRLLVRKYCVLPAGQILLVYAMKTNGA